MLFQSSDVWEFFKGETDEIASEPELQLVLSIPPGDHWKIRTKEPQALF